MLKWHQSEIQMNHKNTQYNSNQYDRIRVLGKGSFGTAIVHRRRADCTLVVLKEIDLSKFRGEQDRKSLIQEARIMSRLNHNNIIKYHNAYLTETKLIIEMEYASVGTLQAYLSFQNQPLEEQEILVIFRQIASGLSYLHSRNIIHLDLKMANIFVTIEGQVKIGDFGIAQIMQSADHMATSQTRTHDNGDESIDAANRASRKPTPKRRLTNNSHQLGTLAYSSPERCLGEPIDCKSDIWSLGCILYELITSRPLFASNSLSELVQNITTVKYEPIQQIISPALRETFEQMISRAPIDRPSSHDLLSLCNQLIAHLQGHRQRSNSHGKQRAFHHNNEQRVNFSSDAAILAGLNDRDDFGQPSINFPHSLVYQVRLDTHHIQIERVHLPQTKRVKEIRKGRSHYLVLTYCNIVYGWGSKNFGQLGACSLTSSTMSGGGGGGGSKSQALRATRSARNSMNAHDLADSSQASSSTTSSLASSTQTITTSGHQNRTHGHNTAANVKGNQSSTNQRLSKQLVMSMLEKSQPASKPFIINELNNKKVIQIAAGNDFSVFLSKTGIVMTCGDGSTGCLGRGDLTSCFMPSMVDALLNCDVVGIACGPRHVVAVCGDGRAFAWGKWTRGRLGIELIKPANYGDMNNARGSELGFETLNENTHTSRMFTYTNMNNEHSNSKSTASKIIIGKYVVRPQLVQLPQDVSIKSAFCGDRCTIFVDSNDRCWACGENNSNKLGLDVKRRFKKTIVVSHSWLPVEIVSLNKYRISSCTISKNHSSFLTNEGKLIVCGQDIDSSHRLKSNIVGNRESHRRISAELQTARRRSHINGLQAVDFWSTKHHSRGVSRTVLNYKQLTESLLFNDQLLEFKYSRANELDNVDLEFGDYEPPLPKYKINKFQRQQIDSYLKKTRATKKMPFEYVISASCQAKFTLTLTNDNRVYFWGTRSYNESGSCLESMHISPTPGLEPGRSRESVQPQLVSPSTDECFIKIGFTNSSLMSNIQLLGSDQPILQAQDPRLTASSLADLWILDYGPTTSSSSDSSSAVSSPNGSVGSHSSICSQGCSYSQDSDGCSCCDQADTYTNNEADYLQDSKLLRLKHDAILEPQPIVSLYVPSMFNHSGCHLNLVNMFCFDESRFYLILDTTIRVQSQSPIRSSSRSTRLTHQFSVDRFQQASQINQNSQLPTTPTKVKLSPLAEPNTSSGHHKPQQVQSDEPQDSDEAEPQARPTISLNTAPLAEHVRICKMNEAFGGRDRNVQEPSMDVELMVNGEASCELKCTTNPHEERLQMECDNPKVYPNDTLAVNANQSINNTPVDSSSSQCGVSLDEPRSFSTFAAAMGHHIIVGPKMNCLGADQSLQPLSFNQQSQIDEYSQLESSPRGYSGSSLASARSQFKSHKRTRRRRANKSESTTITGDDIDDTSSMPSWVKNEFFNHQNATRELNDPDPQLFAMDLSPNDQTDLSGSEESDVTLANHVEEELKENGIEADQTIGSINHKSCKSPSNGSRASGSMVDDDDETLVDHNECEKFYEVPPSAISNDRLNEHPFISIDQELSSSSDCMMNVGGSQETPDRPTMTKNKSFLQSKLISRSQPDIQNQQEKQLKVTDYEIRRSSFMIDGVNGCSNDNQANGIAGGPSNLLHCSVYKPTNQSECYLSDNSYQSLAYLSALSSRRGSVHPMTVSAIANVDSELAANRQEIGAATVAANSSAIPLTDFSNSLCITNAANQESELDAIQPESTGSNANEAVKLNFKQVHNFLHANGRIGSTLTRSVNRLHDHQEDQLTPTELDKRWKWREKSRATSCTSIDSMRKSLAKLFC